MKPNHLIISGFPVVAFALCGCARPKPIAATTPIIINIAAAGTVGCRWPAVWTGGVSRPAPVRATSEVRRRHHLFRAQNKLFLREQRHRSLWGSESENKPPSARPVRTGKIL